MSKQIENKRGLQLGYSQRFAKYMYDEPSRRNKALRAVAMFRDMTPDLSEMNVLEVGSATGIMTFYLADFFRDVTGIDIDRPALAHAQAHYKKPNIRYLEADALSTPFDDDQFDAIVCHHTYEHVADSQVMMDEIYRILKPGGMLYFGAPNRLMIKESHYGLYFLSWLPRGVASAVLRLLGKDEYYYERMRTYWGIKKLLKAFTSVEDYTLRCILQAEKYHSQDVVAEYPFLRYLPYWLVRAILPFAPDYVFLVKK